MFTKKTAPARYLISILLLAIIFTSIPFISAEPAEAADYSKAVVDAYRYKDDENHVEYIIPKINLKGSGFEAINKEIWKQYYGDGPSKAFGYHVKYEWFVKDDILSLKVIEWGQFGYRYRVWNVILSNGSKATNSYVLSKSRMTEKDFYNKVKDIVGSFYYNSNTNLDRTNKTKVDKYNSKLQNLLSDRNIKQSIPYYDTRGELCFLTPGGQFDFAYEVADQAFTGTKSFLGYDFIVKSFQEKQLGSNIKNKYVAGYDKPLTVQAYPVNFTVDQAKKLCYENYFRKSVPINKIRYNGIVDDGKGKRYFVFTETQEGNSGFIDTKTGETASYVQWWGKLLKEFDNTTAISGITDKNYTGSTITQSSMTVKYNGKTLKQGTDYTVAYKNNTNVGTATVEVTGMGDYGGKITKTFKITAKMPAGATRVYGSNRFDTSTKIADSIKSLNGNKRFSSIIVATGTNYPDALSGSYLAKVKNAPIILTNKTNETTTVNYIKNNLSSGGTVYILGGQGAVSADFSNKLYYAGINRVRLGGTDRIDTNLKVLNTAGNFGDELIVVTGWNYPDALSASAIGKPILLVGKSLTKSQKDFLKSKKFKKITVIGGTSAVSQSVANELGTYGTVNRVAGKNRYDTSAQIARKYFSKATDVVLATGKNYPDALSGGPLAIKKKAPLILTSNVSSEYTYARSYISSVKIKKSTVIGGEGLINNGTMTALMK